MKEQISGIVLRTVKYGDTGLIVDLFTRHHGRRSFMTTLARSRIKGGNIALLRPLTILSFVSDLSSQRGLPRLSQMQVQVPYTSVPYDPRKSALALFLSECLCYALHEQQPDEQLYHYIVHSLRWLDTARCDFSDFHLVFLIRLTRFLGIYPNVIDLPVTSDAHHPSSAYWFDLQDATFSATLPPHPYFLTPEETRFLPSLLRISYSNMRLFRLNRIGRQRILQQLNLYYSLHVPSFPQLRSIDVLRQVFD